MIKYCNRGAREIASTVIKINTVCITKEDKNYIYWESGK